MAIQPETVVATALRLLDEVGIEGLTMRRLADALDIKAASLYWHFPGKQALLDAMADALIEGVARGDAKAHSWQKRVRTTSAELRQALLARRDGARVFTGTYVATENVLRVAESIIGPLRDAGAADRLAAWGGLSIVYYTLGFVAEEQAFAASPREVRAGRLRFKEMAARHPHVLAVIDEMFSESFDLRFTTGVNLWIAGIEAQLEKRAGR
jgi:TetR/AcrR family transcriptional regulator, tetracycline repressor protein